MGGQKRSKKSSSRKQRRPAKKQAGRKKTKHTKIESALLKKVTRRDFIKKAALGAAGIGVAAYALSRLDFYGGGRDMRAESHIFRGDAPDKPWKWSKEAYHYMKFGRDTQCTLCPHHCRLSPGDRSICRGRVNIDGRMYSLVYGNPCAVHVDPIEKKPLYHFLPATKAFSIATAGCNMRCLNCQNWQISQFRPEDTKNTELFPGQVVQNAIASSSRSIAYTYSEPSTFYEYMFDTAKLAHQQGLKNVWVTAGYINPEPLTGLCRYLDAANVDLKSFSNSIYSRLNGAALDPVLRTLKLLKEKNKWFEVTWLAVPTWTDDMDMIRDAVEWIYRELGPDHPVHFSRFNPLYKLTNLPPTPVSTLEKARKVALDAGLHHVYIGNVPGHSAGNTYCPDCGSVVIRRRGYSIDLSGLDDGSCAKCGRSIAGVWR